MEKYKIVISWEHWTPKRGVHMKSKPEPVLFDSRQEAEDYLRKTYPNEIYFVGKDKMYGGLLNKKGERRWWKISINRKS